ncbi:hypothetical protein GIB67_027519 [Kingdonia uniflora]|uniref:Uncharacterized protein n=1 Tax=Kingdonia uniflora TaxID=39325 RepID=A0A7J7MFQ9_9MAGN|nr:hypothetical protein GIB67_027519 [Kingdonia uniflora]
MKLIKVAVRSFEVSRQWGTARGLSTGRTSGGFYGDNDSNSQESADNFEKRIFGGLSGNSQNNDPFLRKLDEVERVRDRFGNRPGNNENSNSMIFDGLDENCTTLSDGMDGKLKKAATNFEFDPQETKGYDGFSKGPNKPFSSRMSFQPKEPNYLRQPARRLSKRPEFETTTAEVLKKADFREADNDIIINRKRYMRKRLTKRK